MCRHCQRRLWSLIVETENLYAVIIAVGRKLPYGFHGTPENGVECVDDVKYPH